MTGETYRDHYGARDTLNISNFNPPSLSFLAVWFIKVPSLAGPRGVGAIISLCNYQFDIIVGGKRTRPTSPSERGPARESLKVLTLGG